MISATRRPRPVFSYPIANMKAPKMSQTVVLENPDRAHRIESAGLAPASPNIAIRKTPTKPKAAAGKGSRIKPAMTARKMAKKYQAPLASPCGFGKRAIRIPIAGGIKTFQAEEVMSRFLVADP